jgi:transcriptional regulator with PAS, ATPase and Fis domain
MNVNVRVIVATNKNLKKLVEEEKFRQDLYYRVNVVGIRLSPLRERVSDIPLLAEHFLDKFRKLHQKSVQTIGPDTMNLLARYRWPGNVRELENAIERAVVLCRGETITPGDLPLEVIEPQGSDETSSTLDSTGPLDEQLLKAERQIIRRTLERFGWNRQLTAGSLAISRTSLFRKMRDLNLQGPQEQ